jgi:DNA invertase Pin-like site-specific DNA recombinase
MEFTRPADELVVVKLDRLGRSTRDVLAEMELRFILERSGSGTTLRRRRASTRAGSGPCQSRRCVECRPRAKA